MYSGTKLETTDVKLAILVGLNQALQEFVLSVSVFSNTELRLYVGILKWKYGLLEPYVCPFLLAYPAHLLIKSNVEANHNMLSNFENVWL